MRRPFRLAAATKLSFAAGLFGALVATSFIPTPALAHHPCHDDAFKFCRNVIPDRALIQHCLERNMPHLTSACRGAFRRGR